MDTYYIGITFFTIMILAIMIAIITGNSYISKDTRSGLIYTFAMILVASISEFLGVLFDGKSEIPIFFHYLVKILEFSVAPCIPIICAKAFFAVKPNETNIMQSLAIAHIMVEVLNVTTNWIFYVDSSNVYHHGKLYCIYMFAYSLSILFFFKEAYFFSKKYQNRNAYVLMLILVFMSCSIAIQTLVPELRIDWATIAIAATFMYIYYNEITQHIDGLTQLLNQRSFFNYTANLVTPATILVFDVDKFKSINDNYGHQYGNECLQKVAEMIRHVYSRSGMCYRIGGDEFAVVLNNSIAKIDKLNAIFEAEQNNLQAENTEKVFPTVSVGYALFNPEYDVVTDVIETADKNMYGNKMRKRGNK